MWDKSQLFIYFCPVGLPFIFFFSYSPYKENQLVKVAEYHPHPIFTTWIHSSEIVGMVLSMYSGFF